MEAVDMGGGGEEEGGVGVTGRAEKSDTYTCI